MVYIGPAQKSAKTRTKTAINRTKAVQKQQKTGQK
jgi:hypothetical protein